MKKETEEVKKKPKLEKEIKKPSKMEVELKKIPNLANTQIINNVVHELEIKGETIKPEIPKILETIFIENVLNFGKETIKVHEISTIIVGPIGGGKSDIIRILHFLFEPKSQNV
jgi:hypothetical protein